ncbi:MAG: DUF2800 domain-containing protein [Planctomycetota bacterium]
MHSKLSPSSASRWLACPGSLEGGCNENGSSSYAAEGSVAHNLAEDCYLLGLSPHDFVGQARTYDGHEIEITKEMADAVQIYLDVIETQSARYDVYLETRIEHSEIYDFGGTIDCAIPSHRRIIDFKYGAGIPVDVINNDQLACYALLYFDRFEQFGFFPIEVTIVQPRANHSDGPVRTWTISTEYLKDFKAKIEAVASGDRAGELHAGDHCKWCPRAAECPELYELTIKTAKEEFDESELTPEVAAEVLSRRSAIKTYLDAVEKWSHGQLDKGESVPGYKLVNTYGNRRYRVSEDEIVRKCRNRKFGKKLIFKTELLSPAQLEKVVGKELVADMVERPHKGTTVVPESDKREAVVRQSAADEFQTEETNA